MLSVVCKTRVQRHPAIYKYGSTGNIVGFVRGQPGSQLTNVGRNTRPVIRYQSKQFVQGFGTAPGRVVNVSFYSTRTKAHHPYLMRGKFLHHTFHQHHYASLAGGVINVTTPKKNHEHTTQAKDLTGGFAAPLHHSPADK